jgi:lysozyme
MRAIFDSVPLRPGRPAGSLAGVPRRPGGAAAVRWLPVGALAAVLTALTGCTEQAREESSIGDSLQALRVCPAGATTEGIDVSTYQGGVDWAAVQAAGLGFGIARISDGLRHDDARFDANWSGIKAAGLVRGAYQYFEPAEDAAGQAMKVVRKVGWLGAGDLPVSLDVEVPDGRSPEAIATQMKIWIAIVTAGTGKRPIIYTARYFWNSGVASRDFSAYPLWVANYGVQCPDTPLGWDSWQIWQYGTSESVPGIAGAVDVDRFDGTLEELRRLAGLDAADASPRTANPGTALESVRSRPAAPHPAGASRDAALEDAASTLRPSGALPGDADSSGRAPGEGRDAVAAGSGTGAPGHRVDGGPPARGSRLAASAAPPRAATASAGCSCRVATSGGRRRVWCPWVAILTILLRRRRKR